MLGSDLSLSEKQSKDFISKDFFQIFELDGRNRLIVLCLFLLHLLTASLTWAEALATSPEKSGSVEELNKELTNPVSSLWSIALQQNNYVLDMGPGRGSAWNSNLNFQPVLPVSLTSEWNLNTRPVITVFNSMPYLDPNTLRTERTTAFGDTVLMEMFSPGPKLAGNWLLGLGPTFIFPTASSDYTGQGKYQLGPAGVVGYLPKNWILGAFVQNWTSFAGDDDRRQVNQMNLQPIAGYFLPDGWSIGYSGNILANWEASGDDVWMVPLGFSVSRVVKIGPLPFKIGVAAQYMVDQPEIGGQRWNIQLNMSPVLPKLIKGTLFGN
jgi:hypothetical protein